MKLYEKQINGETVIKKKNEILINTIKTKTDKKTGIPKEIMLTILNPNEEDLFADGWVEYKEPIIKLSEEEQLLLAKKQKTDLLYQYDKSCEINDCIIVYNNEELHYWADKTERSDLKNAIRDCLTMNRDQYRLDLRDKGISFVISCNGLLQILATLEIYAIDCYNKTTDHAFAIEQCHTIEEVKQYDFCTGYPQKPVFYL